MKILDVIQGSPEWELLRRTSVGASDCAAICGIDPYKKPDKLWKQKFTGEKQYISPAMERGKQLEPLARSMFERSYGIKFPPLVGMSDEFDFMIASFDGYNVQWKSLIEIKCPNEKLFDQIILERKIPKSYIYQIQHQLFVCGSEYGYLIPFNGLYFEEIVVERDETIIKEIIAKERHFYECLINGEYIQWVG